MYFYPDQPALAWTVFGGYHHRWFHRYQERRLRCFGRRPLPLPHLHHRCGRHPFRHGGHVCVVLLLETGRLQERDIPRPNRRIAEIENWTSDIYRPAPSDYRPDVTKKGLAKQHKAGGFLPTQSRFTPSDNLLKGARPTTAYGKLDSTPHKRGNPISVYGSLGGKGSKSVISQICRPGAPPRFLIGRGSRTATARSPLSTSFPNPLPNTNRSVSRWPT
jgi:hypothetical protein